MNFRMSWESHPDCTCMPVQPMSSRNCMLTQEEQNGLALKWF